MSKCTMELSDINKPEQSDEEAPIVKYHIKHEPNQLHPDLVSISGFNPWLQHDSSGRVYMVSSHIGQMLVIKGATERQCQTGMEREYGKYTFNVKMPVDGLIVEIIDRYKQTLGKDSINENPQTIVIYENIETKELGMISLTRHCSNHQYFGFQYVGKDGLNKLTVGSEIKKDTVFLDSPNVSDDGGYKYGINLNMALMTMPASSEDGILICEDILPKLAFKTYENRVVEWGDKKFALNLYGDKDNYKPFPDIGDEIRADGLLMALRSYEPDLLSIVEQSVKDTMDVDLLFDTTIYANGPGGKVVDIKIHHDINKSNYADVHMDSQAQKYDHARRQFYGKIVEIWKKYHYRRGDSLQITPELQRLVVEALSVTTEGTSQRVGKLYRKAPLDNYRVEFVIEYNLIPDIGNKLTCIHGGKGIICQKAPRSAMPVDEEGNIADIVMDPNSTIARMNLGRAYEMYYNAASRDTHKRLCSLLKIKPNTPKHHAQEHLQNLLKTDENLFKHAWYLLLGYYEIVSPRMHTWCTSGELDETLVDYMATIIQNGIYLFIPTDNEPESPDIVKAIEANSFYRPVYGPVSYVGNSGKRITTQGKVRIAPMYFILLEKIGDDWSAVASAKLSHFGVPSQLTKADKYSKPARNQAVRGAGEAEVRIYASYIDERFIAEMMDKNNNPKTHKAMIKTLMSAPYPSDIDKIIDRSKIPYGGSKPLELIKHISSVGGWTFKFKTYVPKWIK